MKSIRFLFAAVLLGLFLSFSVRAQFSQVYPGALPGVIYGSVAWGDYNNDGKLDLFLTGRSGSVVIARLYQNTGDGFVEVYPGTFTGVQHSSVAWCDYNNDGKLDILVCGEADGGVVRTQLYRNTGDGFTEVFAGAFATVRLGAVAWGDYDNDGKPDILLTGYDESKGYPVSKIYHNTGSGFTEVFQGTLAPVSEGTACWLDIDNDGKLDILLSGYDINYNVVAKLYRNTNIGFAEVYPGSIDGIVDGSIARGDYNNDGMADILVNGYDSAGYYVTKIFRNTGSGFVEDIQDTLPGVGDGFAQWGDFNNDGLLDIVLTGADYDNSKNIAKIFRNTGAGFIESPVDSLIGVSSSLVTVGDFDNDGRLDIIVGGDTNNVIAILYKNQTPIANTLPQAPAHSLTVTGHTVRFHWAPATDLETPSQALSYNFGLGSDTSFIIAPMADFTTGRRHIPAPGNRNHDTGYAILHLPNGTYHWGVQTIDNAFYGSPFGPLDTFTVASTIVILPASFDFGLVEVGVPVRDSGMVNNTGTDTLRIFSIISTAPEYSIDPITGSIPPGDSMKFYLTFTPSTAGVLDAAIIFSHNAAGSPESIPMTGAGALPVFSSSASSISFPGVGFGSSKQKTLTITNDGLVPLRISSVASTGTAFTVSPGNATILPADNQVFTVTFIPESLGTVNDSIIFTHNAAGSFTYIPVSGTGTPFVPVFDGTLIGERYGKAVWGDYDNDGKLDVLLIGDSPSSKGGPNNSIIYHNTGSGFEEVYPGAIDKAQYGAAAWGDYDNDGLLDIAICGYNGSSYIAKIYHNTGSGFAEVYPGSLTGMRYSSVAWGDYDNDGRLDLLMTGSGSTSSTKYAKIYHNTGSGFIEVYAGSLTPVSYGTAVWGDLNNDGMLDIVLSGYLSSSSVAKVYLNNGSGFTEYYSGALTGMANASISLGDYDNDGRLDILMTGGRTTSTTYRNSKIYHNTGSGFTEVYSGSLTAVTLGSAVWGDYDNDGKLDILLAGYSNTAKIYHNTGSGFVEAYPGTLTGVRDGSVAWGDYDNDGRLDILLTGYSSSRLTQIYHNILPLANTPPQPPTGLSVTLGNHTASFHWLPADDGQTPPQGLSYNLRIGAGAGNSSTMSPMADQETGLRRIPALGNTSQDTGWTIANLPGGTYTWSVQAIDNAFAGSSFAPAGTFSFSPVFTVAPATLNISGIAIGSTGVDSLHVSNTGFDTLIIASVTSGSSKFTVEPFTGSIPSGMSRAFAVRYSPLSFESDSALIVFHHNAPNASDTVIVRGHASGVAVAISPDSLHFENVRIGTSKTDSMLITNSGADTLHILSIQSPRAEFTVSPSTAVVPPGADVVIHVTFTPTTMTPETTGIVINHNGGGLPVTYTVIGAGIAPLFRAHSNGGPDLPFGRVTVGSSKNESFIIENDGTDTLIITSGTSTNPAIIFFSDFHDFINFPIPPHSAIAFHMTFEPTAMGDVSSNLIFVHNGGTSPDTVHAYGTGVLPIFSCPTASLHFDSVSVGSASTDSITITNSGNDTLIISSVISTATAFGVTPLNATIPGGQNRKFAVAFTPETTGTVTAAIIFTHNAAGSPDTIPASGTGVIPAFSCSPATLAFDNIAVGSNKTDSIFVQNTGSGPLVISSVVFHNSSFTVSPTSGTVNTGGRMKFLVTFTPHDALPALDTLRFTHNAAGSPSPVIVHGTSTMQPFSERYSGVFPQLSNSTAAWGDYDNDGRLDLIIAGRFSDNSYHTQLYHNTDSGFVEVYPNTFLNIYQGSMAWGDYDNDGLLDVVISGMGASGRMAGLFHNTGHGFTEVYPGSLEGSVNGSVSWGDYDNDGKLDLLMSGDNSGLVADLATLIYHNTGNGFVKAYEHVLPVVGDGAAVWGDYDNDGRLDILITGNTYTGDGSSKIFHNTGSGFAEVYPGSVIGLIHSSAAWGDYDNDGRLDIVIAGNDGDQSVTKVYHNTGNGFAETYSGMFRGLYSGTIAWGDYNNDGRLDFLVSGNNGNDTGTTLIYRNTGSGFEEISNPGFAGIFLGSATWADYDNDGRLDVFLTGYSSGPPNNVTRPESKLYHNNATVINTVPSAPTGLSAAASGSVITLRWNKAADPETPPPGLSYNIRLGTAPRGISRMSPMADTGAGYRRVPSLGNTNEDTSWAIGGLSTGTYYWSVQTIDQAFAGSPFAPEGSFTIAPRFTAAPAVVHFDSVTLGYSKVDSVVVRNSGADILTISSVHSTSERFIVTPSNGSITSGDIMTFSITYTPSTIGWDSTALLFAHNGAGSPDTIVATGFGTSAMAQITPAAISFNNVRIHSSKTDSILVANTGTRPLIIGSISATLPEFSVPSSGGTIAPGASRKFPVTFTPTVPGLLSAKIIFQHNAPGSPDTVSVSGAGIGPVFSVAPHALSFGPVGLDMMKSDSVTVTNTGTDLLTILQTSSTDSEFAITPSTAAIAVGDSRTFRIMFTPTTPGSRSAKIVFTHDAPGSNDTVALSGTGAFFSTAYPGSLPGVVNASVAWGDYDRDGKLDIILTGNTGSGRISKIYHSTGSGFTEAFPGSIVGVERGSVNWGDYDNDGKLDLLVAGESDAGYIAKIYHNTGAGFAEAYPGSLTGVRYSAAAWGDLDNDGKPDIVLAGWTGLDYKSAIYRNTGTGFTEVYTGSLPGVYVGSISLGDIDNDGRSDILLTGETNGTIITKLFHNTGTGFPEMYPGTFTGVRQGSTSLGDFNNDGKLDILLTGTTGSSAIAKIYQNTGSGFIAAFDSSLAGISNGSACWGDYDNDGRLDVLLSGFTGTGSRITRIYRNNGTGFTGVGEGILTGMRDCSIAWGDYDNDGRLDMLVAGEMGNGYASKIYRNEIPAANTPPQTPGGLTVSTEDRTAHLHWHPALDAETPQQGLSYNIRLGKTPNGISALAPMANTGTGLRLVPAIGNANQDTSWSIGNLPGGTYYWSVQAVDHAFTGSAFASEGTFALGPVFAPSVASLPFGSVLLGSSRLDSLIISNTGNDTLLISSVVADNPRFSVAPASGSIPVSGSMKFYVTFTPSPEEPIAAHVIFTSDASMVHDSIAVTGGTLCSLTVTASNGTVMQNPAPSPYAYNTPVQLTAVPLPNHHFSNWSGDLSGEQNPDTILMDGNKSVTANIALDSYIITASAGTHGSIEPSGEIPVLRFDNQHFAFIPDRGYEADTVYIDNVPQTGLSEYTFDNMNTTHAIRVVFRMTDAYGTMYRTFTYDSLIVKKAIKKAPVTQHWEFIISNGGSSPLSEVNVVFKNDVRQILSLSLPGFTASGAKKAWKFSGGSLPAGGTLHIIGRSAAAKPQLIAKLYLGVITAKPSKTNLTPVAEWPELPMPNSASIRDLAFAKAGFAKTPWIIGVNKYSSLKGKDSTKYFGWVKLKKSGDMYASMIDRSGMHTQFGNGFDYLGKTAFTRGQSSLPPAKHNDKTFADLMTLQFNILLSRLGITTPGFGELMLHQPISPFDNMLLRDIASHGDSMMTYHERYDGVMYQSLDSLLAALNGSFSGAIDTVSWRDSLTLTGIAPLIDHPYLDASGLAPAVIVPLSGAMAKLTEEELPTMARLEQNYPNPFNPATTIRFALPFDGTVSLTVYNVLGQEIARLLDREMMDAGAQEVIFNGLNLPSGIYFYRIAVEMAAAMDDESAVTSPGGIKRFTDVKKMLLVK